MKSLILRCKKLTNKRLEGASFECFFFFRDENKKHPGGNMSPLDNGAGAIRLTASLLKDEAIEEERG